LVQEALIAAAEATKSIMANAGHRKRLHAQTLAAHQWFALIVAAVALVAITTQNFALFRPLPAHGPFKCGKCKHRPRLRRAATLQEHEIAPLSEDASGLPRQLVQQLNCPSEGVSLATQLEFSRNGHVCTRGLFHASEISSIRDVVEAVVAESELQAWQWTVRSFFGEEMARQMEDVYDCEEVLDGIPVAFLQHFNLWRRSAAVRCLTHSPRLGKVAAQLLGVSGTRLYQDSVFVKRPGDSSTRWHADLHMAPFDTNDMVTCWLPLRSVPAQVDGGSGLTFVSGSHRDVAMSFWRQNPQLGVVNLEERYGEGAAGDHHGALDLGDATWHHGWIVHGAPRQKDNDTVPRMAIAIAYIADGVRIRGDDTEAKMDDEDRRSYEAWLSDLKPGGIAKHELLPLVYSGCN